MKKISILFVLAAVSFSFVACGGSAEKAPATPDTTVVAPTTPDTTVVAPDTTVVVDTTKVAK